jgi:hypothetical protein
LRLSHASKPVSQRHGPKGLLLFWQQPLPNLLALAQWTIIVPKYKYAPKHPDLSKIFRFEDFFILLKETAKMERTYN